MKWAVIGVLVFAFLICVLGIFACAMAADNGNAKEEEINARWLLLGAIVCAVAIWITA